MHWLLYLVSVALATCWLAWRYKHRRMIKMAQNIPGPPCLPLIGNAHQLICQPEEMVLVFKNIIADYGDVATFWLGPDLNYIISNPDDLKILLSNSNTSTKGPQYKYMADMLGGGILSGSGPQWRKHRKIVNPNFSKRAIENYNNIFNKDVNLLLEKLSNMNDEQEINIYKYIVQTTSYSVCQTLMGLTKEETINLAHLQEIIDESPRLYDIIFQRMSKWHLQIDPLYWLTNLYQEQKNISKKIKNFCLQTIKHRMDKLNILEQTDKEVLINADEDSTVNTHLSVIDRFILSKEINHHEMIDEIFTIFTASQEATAKIASFLISMMAYHEKCQERLYEEITSVIGNVDRPITDEDFNQMPYLEMVFKEVLRLFPIGVMLQRTVSADITISTCTLPAGCSLVVPIFCMHRDPRFWERPDAFDPDRFTPENMKKRNPNCYIPFSLGPMNCLGRYFGIKLVKLIAVAIIRQFKVTSSQTYNDMQVVMAISAVSKNGYPVFLNPRKKNNKGIYEPTEN